MKPMTADEFILEYQSKLSPEARNYILNLVTERADFKKALGLACYKINYVRYTDSPVVFTPEYFLKEAGKR